jgi:Tol biopolymer transport system component
MITPRNIFPVLGSAVVGCMLFSMCSSPAVPTTWENATDSLTISPDYAAVTMPANIAPLNFKVTTEADEYLTHIHSRKDADGFTVGGKTLDIPAKKWKAMLAEAQGDTVFIDIYVRRDGKWYRYPRISNAVAEEIDPFISYRLIEPSYIGFEEMEICQRDLRNFKEERIYANTAMSDEDEGQCINCHSYQNYNRDQHFQMHVRLNHGGTLIARGDTLKKVNLKTESTISSGVYPAWHPTLPLIAYSVNETSQSFHTRKLNKIEVQDAGSDLILYDVNNDYIKIIANDSTEMETFPTWSPDGKWLYYVSAKIPPMTHEQIKEYQNQNYKDFKYDIYRKPFDAKTLTFGTTDTVFQASRFGRSATLPRISPDGRFLIFTMGEYGTFHIWHRDSDLYILDLERMELRPLSEVNSRNVESYHSWSSNGRWIIFSSRRDDGSYTRLYMAHIDKKGRAGKPFLLPQRDPDQNARRFKSYNIPEFMVCPVDLSQRQIINAIKEEPRKVTVKN